MNRTRKSIKPPRLESPMGTGHDDDAFSSVVAAFTRNKHVVRGKMFGSVSLKVDGRVFAMAVKGKLVVKLAKERVDALVDAGDGKYFDPGHGRPMKEWVAVANGGPAWIDLAKEAYRFVKGAD